MRLIILMLLVTCTAYGQVITKDGLDMYATDEGDAKITLLFIHGWNLDHTFWGSQRERFRGDYRVVTVDLPGFGESGSKRTDWSMAMYGSDIRQVIDQLGLEHVVLVAHSMAGNIAFFSYLEDSTHIDGIIGVDNYKDVGAKPDSITYAQMDKFYEYVEADYTVHIREASAEFFFSPDSPPKPKEKVLSAYASSDPEIAIATFKAVFRESFEEARQLSKVHVPMTVIASDLGPFNKPSLSPLL